MTHNNTAASAVIAGFGFRGAATVASLRGALQAALAASESAAGQQPTLTALSTAEDKATHPALIALSLELTLPLLAVPLTQMVGQTVTIPTRPTKLIDSRLDPSDVAASNRIPERYGARSVAESSALAAAGTGARLLSPRTVSADQMATAAIAVFIAIPIGTTPL